RRMLGGQRCERRLRHRASEERRPLAQSLAERRRFRRRPRLHAARDLAHLRRRAAKERARDAPEAQLAQDGDGVTSLLADPRHDLSQLASEVPDRPLPSEPPLLVQSRYAMQASRDLCLPPFLSHSLPGAPWFSLPSAER